MDAATAWFNHCRTVDEVKAEYRRLCFMYHPDHGGDGSLMQSINVAYRRVIRQGIGPQSPLPTARYGPPTPSAWTAPPAQSDPRRAVSTDGIRAQWQQTPWLPVGDSAFRRTVANHAVTLIRFTADRTFMWAIQVDDQFSAFAYQTRPEAEADAFQMLLDHLTKSS
ncbi:MAG: hypothetical protein NVS2B7_21620 [Herpetosiphon sp.]